MARSNARRVRMVDIARDAGVSVMTVSYTFSHPDRVAPATRERVERSAQRLGYQGPNPSARSLRQGWSNSLAVVVGEGLPYAFDDAQSVLFLSGVAAVCLDFQQNMMLLPVSGEDSDVDRVQSAAADAFILWTGVSDGPVLDAVLATGKPVVVQGAAPASALAENPHRTRPAMVVTIDNVAAAEAVAMECYALAAVPGVVSFTLERGDRPRIVYGPAFESVVYPNARDRLAGIRRACLNLGLDWAAVPVAVAPDNDRHAAAAIVDTLLGLEPGPDAVVAMSDPLALAVRDAALKRGLVPGVDLAFSGWDDSPVMEEVGVTSVRQSLQEQGAQCAILALQKLDEPSQPSWSLVARASTNRASGQSATTPN